MKRIFVWLFMLMIAAVAARAQDAELTERVGKLEGYLQDVQAAQEAQNKRLEAMEKEISGLRDQLNQPGANNNASQDDLKKLAEQIQEIDKKRQSDNELILKTVEKLGKVGSLPASSHKPPGVSTAAPTDSPAATATGPQKGYDYTIAPGDTVSAIAKAYRAKGVKVTKDQILKANPGLNPNSLIVGKKIFIPAAAP